MVKRRTIVGVGAAVILAAGGYGLLAGGEAGGARNVLKLEDLPADRGFVSMNAFTRGNARTLYGAGSIVDYHSGPPVTGKFFSVVAGQEIDATTITYSVSFSPTVQEETHILAVTALGDTEGYSCPGGSYLKGMGTIVHTFNPPVRLRAGDTFNFVLLGPRVTYGANIDCQVFVHGFVPPEARTEGFTVQ